MNVNTCLRPLTLLFALLLVAVGCAPSAGRPSTTDEAPRPAALKRITTVISTRDPMMIRSSAGGIFGGSAPGIDALEDMVNAGATRRDESDALRPMLAESLPTLENGLWKVFPDGRIETSWTVKNGARWQDGAPFTAQDLLFTLTVCMDDDMVAFGGHVGFDFIDAARAPDERTITVTWKQPFIEADALFTTQFAMPMPRHLLERAYIENRSGVTDLPYWNREFVGAGPFKLRDWVDGSHMVLVAFDGFVLGRPKIDEIVVKYILDPSTLVANMLSGETDVNVGRGMSLEQALQIRDQWREGRLDVGLVNWVVAYGQFIDPRPVVQLDVRFRKALVHAIDRQEMADVLQGGMTPIAHSYFNTSLPRYRELDPYVVKYDFDPRRSIQLIESTGYVRGADGMFRDPSGERLTMDIRTSGQQELQTKAQLSVADYWQRVGLAVETLVISPQRRTDREYRATRPGFEVLSTPDEMKGLRRAHSSETPLPENGFGKSGNNARYVNPEFDALIERFFSTIPVGERMQVLGQVLRHSSDQVSVIGLFHGTAPTMANNRLLGVGPRSAEETTVAWNVYAWDVR
ncbi:MAG: hypothetical protein HW416_1584 [Chloroflexi bacterium]|nr:hypothetical protein [Chloroflexota bacterium]